MKDLIKGGVVTNGQANRKGLILPAALLLLGIVSIGYSCYLRCAEMKKRYSST